MPKEIDLVATPFGLLFISYTSLNLNPSGVIFKGKGQSEMPQKPKHFKFAIYISPKPGLFESSSVYFQSSTLSPLMCPAVTYEVLPFVISSFFWSRRIQVSLFPFLLPPHDCLKYTHKRFFFFQE